MTRVRWGANIEKRKEIIPFAKPIFDDKEINSVLNCLKNGWLGEGKLTETFEKKLADYIGTKHATVLNSGSSANLLAVRALNLPEGSKVLTCVAGFPSTLNPIWHSHLDAVGVDLDLKTLNIDLDLVEEAIKKTQPKAIIFAHTLGNPVDMNRMMGLANKHDMQVIEDNCDALGSKIFGKKTGSFGNFSTCSFYASHHITLAGGGGAIFSNTDESALMIKSMKEWGKEQVTTGFEKDHGVFFDSESNGVPYDHRYSYPYMGYNFKIPEIMSAFGMVQMGRLEFIHKKRRENFSYLYKRMQEFSDFFDYVEWHKDANPSWFNFPVTLKDNLPFTRKDLVEHIEKMNIRTRLFFAGNIMRHKGFSGMKMQLIGDMKTADKVHKDSFLLGIHPSLDKEMIDYTADVIGDFIKKYKK